MFNFFLQSMHLMNAYVILFLASAKTGDNGIHKMATVMLQTIQLNVAIY